MIERPNEYSLDTLAKRIAELAVMLEHEGMAPIPAAHAAAAWHAVNDDSHSGPESGSA